MTQTISRVLLSVFAAAFLAATAAGQVDRVAPDRLPLELEGGTLTLPYYSTHALGEAHEGVTTAFIMVHGTLRNAHSYQPWALSAARAAGVDGHTVVVSPQFLIEQDLEPNGVDQDVAFWTNAGWKRGNLSRSTEDNPRPARISSYEAMDRLILLLADTLPHLERVIVAGHSAGGQFAHRYAIGTPIVDELEQRGLSIGFFVSNPSSYTYFTPERPLIDGAEEFAEPPDDSRAGCPNFNRFIYGPDNLNEYIGRLSVDELAARYASRRVTYLLGDADNDPQSRYLDTSCGAMLQGTNRFDRGLNYYRYLGHRFGEGVYERHTLVVVPGVGHSARLVYNSRDGLDAVFAAD